MNVGSSEEVSILGLAEMIKDVVGFKGIIAFDETKPNGNDRKLLDSSLARKYGWKSKTNLNQNLLETYNFYLKELKLNKKK